MCCRPQGCKEADTPEAAEHRRTKLTYHQLTLACYSRNVFCWLTFDSHERLEFAVLDVGRRQILKCSSTEVTR